MEARQEDLLETVRLELEKMEQNKALLRIFTVGKAGVGKLWQALHACITKHIIFMDLKYLSDWYMMP